MTTHGAPRPSRPHMPAYGIEPTEDGLIPWSEAERRLTEAHNYYLATSRPLEGGDTRPHLMPLWALWTDRRLYFSTDGAKARNLRRDPRCSIATEDGNSPVILEGNVASVPRGEPWDAVQAAYTAKYGMPFPDDSPLFALTPTVAFAFTEADDQFTATATRYHFD
jgi:hypothetical protein